MKNFKPTDSPTSILKRNKSDLPPESFNVDNENITTEPIAPASTDILECVPSLSPPYEEPEKIQNSEYKELIRKQELDRFHQSEEFQRQESQLLSNYYDAQVRENTQKNEVVDKRPISDALRYLSKRIAYPIELGVQRFYKYNFRCEKILKKHKKAMDQMHNAQDQRAECLYQGQLQELAAFDEYNKLNSEEIKAPRLPTNTPTE